MCIVCVYDSVSYGQLRYSDKQMSNERKMKGSLVRATHKVRVHVVMRKMCDGFQLVSMAS